MWTHAWGTDRLCACASASAHTPCAQNKFRIRNRLSCYCLLCDQFTVCFAIVYSRSLSCLCATLVCVCVCSENQNKVCRIEWQRQPKSTQLCHRIYVFIYSFTLYFIIFARVKRSAHRCFSNAIYYGSVFFLSLSLYVLKCKYNQRSLSCVYKYCTIENDLKWQCPQTWRVN